MTKPDAEQSKADREEKERDQTLDLYKAYLEDLGRIGSRQETLRQFYLSVISALFVLLAMAGEEGLFKSVSGWALNIVGAVGILICGAWLCHMWSFGGIFMAKRASLKAIEQRLPVKPFTLEDADDVGRLKSMCRLRLTIVDRWLAVVFMVLFAGLVIIKLK